MATNRTIRGLSGRGFRVLNSASKIKVCNENTSVVVDVDNTKGLGSSQSDILSTREILSAEKDNYIRTKETKALTSISNANPAVCALVGHGLTTDDMIVFSTTGALPAGLTVGTKYFVLAAGLTANAFEVALTSGGAAIATTNAGSGTHTFIPVSTSIIGLTRYGIRIRTTASSAHGTLVKLGSGVHVIDLTDGRVRRTLRRSYGRYMVATNANSVNIRGLFSPQRGFDVKPSLTGAGVGASSNIALTANASNPANADTVVVGSNTYTFKTALSETFATDTVTTSGTPASTRASGTITSPSTTGAGDGSTIQIGGTTYTFKTTLSSGPTVPNEILRDGTRGNDLTNLVQALTSGVTNVGVKYSVGTAARTDITITGPVANVATVTAVSYNAAIGNAIALVAGGGTPVTVSGAVLSGGVNQTVTVNARVYKLVEALTTAATGGVTANEVLINGQDTTLDNFGAAINAAAGVGTTYSTGTTVNVDVSCGTRATHTVTLTAKAALAATGNALTLAVAGAQLARGTATFAGGVDTVANEVKVGGTGDLSLTNLSEAINAGAHKGTDYSTATTANADATASALVSATKDFITVSAVEGGLQEIAVSTTAANLTVANATLEDPLARVYGVGLAGTSPVTAMVNPQDPAIYTQLRRHYQAFIVV